MLKNKLSRIAFVLAGLALVLVVAGVAWSDQAVAAPRAQEGVDHSVFPQLAGPFEKPQEITAACLTCHPNAAQDVMATVHWTWEYTDPVTGQQLGKNNVVNNYCIAMPSNEPRCTSCHIGYGYANKEFDFTVETNVDCLACHADTAVYKKFPAGAGMPWLGDEPKEFPPGSGKMWEKIDLVASAQSVGLPTRANCGSCHFFGGGGDAVKHGDLDSSMGNPALDVDVHMSPEGNDFSCIACHAGENHEIKGRIYTGEEAVLCEDCHTGDHAPHADSAMGEALSAHTEVIACQTCHIPAFARGRTTKMTWDWSTAGEKNEEGKPFAVKDENGDPTYDSKKGTFTWASNVTPEYAWWNGETRYLTPADKIDPSAPVILTDYQGSRGDGKIYPFKYFTGKTPYDAGNSTMAVPNLFPNGEDPNAYWKNWDWDAALASGMEYAGYEYSGEYGFVDTVFMFVQNHQVAPSENAVQCQECHTAEGGRLDFAALGYDEAEVAKLTVFPPAASAPEATEEAAPAPTEEAAPVEEAPAESEAEGAPPAGLSGGSTLWIALIVVLVLVVVAYFVMRKNKQEA
ncbi:MAG: tetrathionate reductase family octaheme c-type cytochrome [Anaerolineales bacterium]